MSNKINKLPIIPIRKIAKIIVLSLEGKSRKYISEEADVGSYSVWRYKNLILKK